MGQALAHRRRRRCLIALAAEALQHAASGA